VFDIWLRTITESTWKILKLDWKTPGIFFFQKSENPVNVESNEPEEPFKTTKQEHLYAQLCQMCIPVCIEIGLYLTDTEQKISWQVFETRYITDQLLLCRATSIPCYINLDRISFVLQAIRNITLAAV